MNGKRVAMKIFAVLFTVLYAGAIGCLLFLYLTDLTYRTIFYLQGTGPLIFLPLMVLIFSGYAIYYPLHRLCDKTGTLKAMRVIGPLLMGVPAVIRMAVTLFTPVENPYGGPRVDGFTAGSFVIALAMGTIIAPYLFKD